MNNSIDELIVHLELESRVLDTLLTASNSLNTAIKNRNLTAIDAAVAQYDAETGQLEALEEKRLILSDAITHAAGITTRHPDMTALIRCVTDETLSKKLAALRVTLKGKMADIVVLKAENAVLLSETLGYISKTFELMATSKNPYPAYKRKGTPDNCSIKRNLINTMA